LDHARTPYEDLVIINTKQKLHENHHVNILLNLIATTKKLQSKYQSQPNIYQNFNIQINYLNHLKTRLLGLLIRKEKFGDELIGIAPSDLEEIHYTDYLALKEKQAETKLASMQESLNESSEENAKLHQIIKEHIQELANVNNQNKEIQEHIQKMTQSLKISEAKIAEHVQTQVSLEGHIDRLLDTQLHNIEDCHAEVLTLDALSETLRKMLSIRAASEEVDVIIVIYDVISTFKERMKIKCEALSSNATHILESFEQLKGMNKLITDTLKRRTEQVLSSYKNISIRISEIVKKLEVQSEMLSTITTNLEKAKQEKAIRAQKEKEEAEKKQREKAEKKAEAREKALQEQKARAELTEKEKKESCEKKPKEQPAKNKVAISSNENKLDNSSNKNLKPVLLSSLQMYSTYASNQWFFYFRMSYKQNKCAKLFKTILNDESLLFEHRLIILNSLIEKILNDANLQKFDTDEFHDVITNIKDSSNDVFENIDQNIMNENQELNLSLFKYSEDLENEVDSGIFYDLCFGKGKYIK